MSFIKDISDYIRSGEADDQNLGLEVEHFMMWVSKVGVFSSDL